MRSKEKLRDATFATAREAERRYGADLRAHYESEMAEAQRTEPEIAESESGGATTTQLERRARPPSYPVQLSRTCMLITPLVAFLRGGGMANRRGGGAAKRRRVDYTRHEGTAVFDQIRHWVRDTEEGRRHAQEHAHIDPDSFHVDHVICEVNGGPTHYYNAHLMPASHNSQFNGWWTADKQNYVGEQAVRAARAVVSWGRERVDWNTFDGRVP